MPQQARDVAGRQQALCLLKLLSHAHTLAKRLRAGPSICLPELRDHGFEVSAAGPADRHDHEPCQKPGPYTLVRSRTVFPRVHSTNVVSISTGVDAKGVVKTKAVGL